MRFEHYSAIVDQITIDAGCVKEFYFSQHWKPNMFCIKNYNPEPVYIGLDAAPTETRFDKVIFPHTDDVISHPTGRERIFLFNPSEEKMHLTVYSDIMDPFDFSLLKNTTSCYIQGIAPGVNLGDGESGKEIYEYLSKTLEDRLLYMINTLTSMSSDLGSMRKSRGVLKVINNSSSMITYNNPLEIIFLSNDGEDPVTLVLISSDNIRSLITLQPGEILNHIDLSSEKGLTIGAGSSVRGIVKVKEG